MVNDFQIGMCAIGVFKALDGISKIMKSKKSYSEHSKAKQINALLQTIKESITEIQNLCNQIK
jgi:hypothetical protein